MCSGGFVFLCLSTLKLKIIMLWSNLMCVFVCVCRVRCLRSCSRCSCRWFWPFLKYYLGQQKRTTRLRHWRSRCLEGATSASSRPSPAAVWTRSWPTRVSKHHHFPWHTHTHTVKIRNTAFRSHLNVFVISRCWEYRACAVHYYSGSGGLPWPYCPEDLFHNPLQTSGALG